MANSRFFFICLMTAFVFTICEVTQVNSIRDKRAVKDSDDQDDGFDYKSVNLWRDEFPQCGQNRQSPIDIDLKSDIKYLHKKFKIKNYDVLPTEMTLNNDGNGVKLVAQWPNGKEPQIYFESLNPQYLFDNLHFHWGQFNSRGSEHTFNGQQFPLEMHLVHYKSSYGSIENALNKHDGIVVIAVIFQIDHFHNGLKHAPIVKNFPLVKQINSQVKIKPFPLSNFKLNRESTYITYQGSLTTPPCSQNVTWLLDTNLHRVTKKQMKCFRQLELKNGAKENFRPIQSKNGRSYYYVKLGK